jgi:HPt (histidine-containing phosphotransfer) domain-containing protein
MTNLDETSVFSILLIESSQDESNHFIDIVKNRYANAEICVFANSFEAVQWLQENETQLLVIEVASQPMNANQTIDYVREELKLDIAVFIVSSSPGIEDHEFRIIKPFTEESLGFLLNYSLEVMSQADPLYSLNYLKDISGGNTEFILETVELFKSSVKKKLKELDFAGETNDYKKAAEIAHNLKPSFEMLENKEGAEICDKLTYDFQNHSINELILSLNLIFEEIVQQLEIDFASKNI